MSTKQKPNILLILTDQHRLSALGCYGQTVCKTPNINALAERGVRFATAYTSCPVCSPARASVMTGKHIHAHGILSNVGNLGSSIHELTDRPELLSRRLQQAGYRCGYTGKWHIGTNQHEHFDSPSTPSLPKDVGFEGHNFPGYGAVYRSDEYNDYLKSHGYHHATKSDPKDPSKVVPYAIIEGPPEASVARFLADHTIELIDRFSSDNGNTSNSGPSVSEIEPFFIWHNFWGPHGPYMVPQSYYDLYADMGIPEWPNFEMELTGDTLPASQKRHPHADRLSWYDWAEAIRHYYAYATLIDDEIGRILTHLSSSGLAENTLVVFSADHGETVGSHGGLTDKGWHHFEEIQRIPLIVSGPESLIGSGGVVRDETASILDLYPTLLDAAGEDPLNDGKDGAVHGESLLPLLRGETEELRDEVFIEFGGVNCLATTMITCVSGSIKYGWNAGNIDELYDLGNDPNETENLIHNPRYADTLKDMRERLERFLVDTDFPGPGLNMYRQSTMRLYENA